jgi:hypothetical protein
LAWKATFNGEWNGTSFDVLSQLAILIMTRPHSMLGGVDVICIPSDDEHDQHDSNNDHHDGH